jgi:hypothetical protein
MAAISQALAVYGAMDPAAWNTGLSAEGARFALAHATAPYAGRPLVWPAHLRPPRRLVIWCAGNVFTAPLEWAATFAAAGSEVVLKAPSSVPEPVLALARCCAAQGLPVEAHALPHRQAWHLLDDADAVLGFGSDSAMLALNAHLGPQVRRALFGHRVSVAVVAGVRDVANLVGDSVLYDGRGCKSPVAVFALAEAEAVAEVLAEGLARAASELPRGRMEPAWGPRWRRRVGLARITDHAHAGPDWAVPVLPAQWFEPEPLPRLLPVHPVRDLEAVRNALAGLPLGTCGTNLDPASVPDLHRVLGFPVVTPLGALHATALDGHHEATDIRAALGEVRTP